MQISGVRAFESLSNLLHEVKADAMQFGMLTSDQVTNIQYCLDSALQYYQNNYSFNLEIDSKIKTHSMNWLLSDPTVKDFQNTCEEEFSGTCEFCELVPKISMALMGICKKLQAEPLFTDKVKIEKWMYTINRSELAILQYRNFIIRNKMSDLDWNSYFSTEKPHSANVIFDFAMNHLPEKPQ